MIRRKIRRYRRLFILIIITFITAVTLAVETYAWFVGLSTASTNEFTISISSPDGLELSLNGSYWTNGNSPLLIKDTNHTYITETGCSNANCAYSGNTNRYPTSLVPVSTIGEIDTTTSKLKLFEESSLSANEGGYYVRSKSISNSSTEENKYVAFDLFIRNGKRSGYNGTYNMNEEEDVYLSADSFATTNISGNTPDYGAANSLRVGFFEIGRVASSGYTASDITGATCTSTNSNVTKLCTGSSNMIKTGSTLYTNDELQASTWNIWEPNHASHTTNLVNYYNASCRGRATATAYSAQCSQLDTGSSKKTYGMKSAINVSTVNVYDGLDLNTYTDSSTYLSEVKTYKTSDATTTSEAKQPILKLAGNSITKVRVYIWLEGQDIDNYDIISKNPSVKVKFGLTKDRYGVDDTNNTSINTRTSSFQDDSWAKIKSNVQNNNTTQYNVGDMKTIRINGNEYRLRLVNKTSPGDPCHNTSKSQTACGFVVEFVDIVENRRMNSTNTNVGGWPATELYTYLQGTFYNNLPSDLKSAIVNTRVISGYGSGDSSNFTTTDKLYLLSNKELSVSEDYESSVSETRTLDYYVDKSKNAKTKQKNPYWLRSAYHYNSSQFYSITSGGYIESIASEAPITTTSLGVAPAFRIG